MKFPTLPYSDGIRQSTQTSFAGINRTAGARDGEIWDEVNIWSGDAHVLSVRPYRTIVQTSISSPNGLFRVGGDRFVADGTTLYLNGSSVGSVTDTLKVFTALGSRVIIFPDKKMWDGTALVSLEAQVSTSCTFTDGTYAGEAALANTIHATDPTFRWSDYFSAGDAVTITGSVDNDKTIIIREIEDNDLRFYENSFVTTETAETITLSRNVPDLDWICAHENRVWGCKGDTICCSKLGDPFNWYVFDGISTDSWSWDTGSPGAFTGCISYMGYPCFFKENQIFKIYGDKPTNFQAMSAPDIGVMAGCGYSLAIANETLFYLSRVGVMAYSGAKPSLIGEPLGVKLTGAVGGSDGLKYYMSGDDGVNTRLYVYDALRRMWNIEDNTYAVMFTQGEAGSVECLTGNGTIWTTGTYGTPEYEPAAETDDDPAPAQYITWSVEFADFTAGSPNQKGISKLLMRMELAAGSTCTLSISYDSSGIWVPVQTLTATVKRSWYLPVIPRRCDHFRLKLTGTGMAKLYSLTSEMYNGSPNHH